MYHSANRACALVVLCALFLVAAGCQASRKPAPPFNAPPLRTGVTHFAGTPLSGPAAAAAPAAPTAPGDAWSVRVNFVALERMPSGGEPLGARARLIVATRAGSPVMSAGRFTAGARIVEGADVSRVAGTVKGGKAAGGAAPAGGRSAAMFDARAALPPGVTATFDAGGRRTFTDPVTGDPTARGLQIQVHRPAAPPAGGAPGAIQIALVVTNFGPVEEDDAQDEPKGPAAAPPSARRGASTAPSRGAPPRGAPPKAAPPPAAPPRPSVLQREVALLDRSLKGGGEDLVTLVVPFRFEGSAAEGVAATVAVRLGSNDPAHLAAVEKCRTDLAGAATLASHGTGATSAAVETAWSTQAALAALARPDRTRSALVFLAGDSGARLCEDVALVAEDPALAKLAAEVRKRAAAAAATPASGAGGTVDFRWLLDRAAFELTSAQLGGGSPQPELAAVLAAHLGEAGRNASSAEQVAAGLATRAEFEARVLAENLIFLDDASPSSRVRAFDWLRARGQAPAGYDPLAPPRDRRAALDRALSAAPQPVPPQGAAPQAPASQPAAPTALPAGGLP